MKRHKNPFSKSMMGVEKVISANQQNTGSESPDFEQGSLRFTGSRQLTHPFPL